ncbi:MAG: hypothetical protein ACI9QL_004154 [Candidatus Omnitrophota bacterium]|jgi:hypothetical protein
MASAAAALTGAAMRRPGPGLPQQGPQNGTYATAAPSISEGSRSRGPALRGMQVNHRRLDLCMTQQRANGLDVHLGLQEVGCKNECRKVCDITRFVSPN